MDSEKAKNFRNSSQISEPFLDSERLICEAKIFWKMGLQISNETTTILSRRQMPPGKKRKSCDPYLVHCRACFIPSYRGTKRNRYGLNVGEEKGPANLQVVRRAFFFWTQHEDEQKDHENQECPRQHPQTETWHQTKRNSLGLQLGRPVPKGKIQLRR